MENCKLCRFLFCMLFAFRISNAFKIKSCDSNKINEIRHSLNSKSVIKIDSNQKIPLNTSKVDVRIWCDSDILIDKCVLESRKTQWTCEKKVPISCSESEFCENNKRIKLVSSSRRRCEFHFDSLSVSGDKT